MTHVTHALPLSEVLNPFSWILAAIEGASYLVFTIAGWFLKLCGVLLNISIQLTTHLGVFIRDNNIIYTVWETIRDFSSMLLIFFILYAAIQMILGIKPAQFKQLILSIVIAGILINFSFFITQVAIDTSNIVSLQFYNAIAPSNQISFDKNDSIATIVTKSIREGDGGLSGIFASSLGVNSWWNGKGEYKTSTGGVNGQILTILNYYTGALVQVLAGLSILAAAIAALWRSIILIFLLGFSAIWIAAYAVPKLDEFKKIWSKHFQANLIFLPVYLAFLYVAVLIASKSGLHNITNTKFPNPTDAYTQLFISFSFIIIVLNIPLLAAIQVSGLSIKFIDKLKGSISGLQKWATVGRLQAGGAWAGRNIGSRAASAVSRSETLRDFAGKSVIGEMALKGLKKTAGSYDKKLGEQVKSRTEFAESLGYDQGAVNREQTNIRAQRALLANPAITGAAKAAAEAAIRTAQQNITDIKNQRKFEYATRTDTRSMDTLFMKRARKDKAAAAKIHIDVWEAQLKDEKDDLKDLKKQVSDVQNQINAQPGGVATGAQTTTLTRLQARQTAKQNSVDNLETNIGNAKLIT